MGKDFWLLPCYSICSERTLSVISVILSVVSVILPSETKILLWLDRYINKYIDK